MISPRNENLSLNRLLERQNELKVKSPGIQNPNLMKSKANGHSGHDANDDKTHYECPTNPTIHLDSISERGFDGTLERPTLHDSLNIKHESGNETLENFENSTEHNDVTEFLAEVNSLNKGLHNRRTEINSNIERLKKEISQLEEAKKMQSSIVNYINKQRSQREKSNQVFKNTSVKVENKSDTTPLAQIVSSLSTKAESDDLKRVPPEQLVFVTEKTQGYKKELENRKSSKGSKTSSPQKSNKSPRKGALTQNCSMLSCKQESNSLFQIPHNCFGSTGQEDPASYINYAALYSDFDNDYTGTLTKVDDLESSNLIGPNLGKKESDKSSYNNLLNQQRNNGGGFLDRPDSRNVNSGQPKPDMNGNYEYIGKVQSNELQPCQDFEHLTGTDYRIDSHPFTQKDVKNEICDSDPNLFSSPANLNASNFNFGMSPDGQDPYFASPGMYMPGMYPNQEYTNILEDPTKVEYDGDFSHMNPDETMIPPPPSFFGMEGHQLQYAAMESMMQDSSQYGEMYFDPAYASMFQDELYGLPHITPELLRDPNFRKSVSSEAIAYLDEVFALCSNGYTGHRPAALRSRKRNKYRMLPVDIKKRAVALAEKSGCKAAAHHLGVPLKSLKRWMKVGCERKKGGGRKTKDPEMEHNLYCWYTTLKDNHHPVTAKMIKEKAMELTNCHDFIASKGWLDKFKVRYNLDISKESAKDGGRRRGPNPDNSKKRKEKQEDDQIFKTDTKGSQRRVLNKAVKQETSEFGSFKEEASCDYNHTNDHYEIKDEVWASRRPTKGRVAINNEIPSILHATQQFDTADESSEGLKNSTRVKIPLDHYVDN